MSVQKQMCFPGAQPLPMSQSVICQPTVSPVSQSSEGSWASGRYECCLDCPMCCVGICCPVILSCYVARKYGEHCCLAVVPGGMTALRTHMRVSYGIPGTVLRDALSMCLCGWCEICRMARELHTRSPS
ncbi:cornifelin-like [Vipera latastei]